MRLIACIAVALGAAAVPALSAPLTQVRMSIDEDPIVVRLARSLGYFAAEGIEIVPVVVSESHYIAAS